jgi:hypothetical protein
MNNPGLSGPPFPRLGPAPTRAGGYPEPASLAPAPPPLRGASRRGRRGRVVFAAEQATASRSRLARGPGGLRAVRRGLNYAANFWDTTLGQRAASQARRRPATATAEAPAGCFAVAIAPFRGVSNVQTYRADLRDSCGHSADPACPSRGLARGSARYPDLQEFGSLHTDCAAISISQGRALVPRVGRGGPRSRPDVPEFLAPDLLDQDGFKSPKLQDVEAEGAEDQSSA